MTLEPFALFSVGLLAVFSTALAIYYARAARSAQGVSLPIQAERLGAIERRISAIEAAEGAREAAMIRIVEEVRSIMKAADRQRRSAQAAEQRLDEKEARSATVNDTPMDRDSRLDMLRRQRRRRIGGG